MRQKQRFDVGIESHDIVVGVVVVFTDPTNDAVDPDAAWSQANYITYLLDQGLLNEIENEPVNYSSLSDTKKEIKTGVPSLM